MNFVVPLPKNPLMMNKVNYVVKTIEMFEPMPKKINRKLYGISNDVVFYCHKEVKGDFVSSLF